MLGVPGGLHAHERRRTGPGAGTGARRVGMAGLWGRRRCFRKYRSMAAGHWQEDCWGSETRPAPPLTSSSRAPKGRPDPRERRARYVPLDRHASLAMTVQTRRRAGPNLNPLGSRSGFRNPPDASVIARARDAARVAGQGGACHDRRISAKDLHLLFAQGRRGLRRLAVGRGSTSAISRSGRTSSRSRAGGTGGARSRMR